MTSSRRKYLRGLAHHLEPVVRIGRAGLSESVFAELDEALESHELIKVRFVDWKDQKRELAARVCERLGCEQVGKIGHVVIFYRESRDAAVREPGPEDLLD